MHAGGILASYIARSLPPSHTVVVSPDVAGVSRARAFAKSLSDAPLAIIDKRRAAGSSSIYSMNLIGDVAGKDAVLVDDLIDTAGTLAAGAELLHARGARSVVAVATHALLSGSAVARLSGGLFKEVVVTNSIYQPAEKVFKQLTVLSVARLLGDTISRVFTDSSTAEGAAMAARREL